MAGTILAKYLKLYMYEKKMLVYVVLPIKPQYITALYTLYSGSSAKVNTQFYKVNKPSFYSKGDYAF